MMKRFLVEILFVMLLIPTASIASDWSVGIDGGLAIPASNFFPTNTGDINTHSLPYFQALNASPGWMISAFAYDKLERWADTGIVLGFDTLGAAAINPVDPSEGGPKSGRTNLGSVVSYDIMASARIHPWTFGDWTPFGFVSVGWSWNQWLVPGGLALPNADFGARLSDAPVVEAGIGSDYRLTDRFSLEGLVGFYQSEPLASVDLPSGTGGMDQNFNILFVFVNLGIRFAL